MIGNKKMIIDNIVTLLAIEIMRKPAKAQVNKTRCITNNLICTLRNSLVSHGCLVVNNLAGYQVTPTGLGVILREAVQVVVCGDEIWAKDRMEILGELSIKISQWLDDIKKSPVKVFS